MWLRVGNAGSPPADGEVEAVVGEVLAQDGHERDLALAGVGLGDVAGDAQAAGGEVEMVGAEPAELADARAREDQRLDHDPPRHVVAVAGFGAFVPELAPADLADQRVRDPELAGERDGRGVGGADVRDLLPRQAAMRRLGERGRAQQRVDLLELEEGAPRALGLRGGGLEVGELAGDDAALLGVAQDPLGGVERPPDRRVGEAAPACLIASGRYAS